MHLVAVGEAMLDVVDGEERAGGSAVNAALAARALGAGATVVARVGDDTPGRRIRAELERAGVEARFAVDGSLPTGRFESTGGAVSVERGASARLEAADVPALAADAVLVSGYVLLHDDTADAGRAGLALPAAWTAADVGARHLVERLGAREAARRVDSARVVFANAEEHAALDGACDGAELVVVKLGEAGARALSRAGMATVDGRRLTGRTIGAGDAFDAGTLVGLARGLGVEASLRLAREAAERWILAGPSRKVGA